MGVFLALLIFRPPKSDTFSGSGSSLMLMEWPHNSPDMNLIESLWYCLETMLRRQFPDTPLPTRRRPWSSPSPIGRTIKGEGTQHIRIRNSQYYSLGDWLFWLACRFIKYSRSFGLFCFLLFPSKWWSANLYVDLTSSGEKELQASLITNVSHEKDLTTFHL